MGRRSRSQIFLDVAYCLFIFLVADCRPVLVGGFLKVVVALAFACLLTFVVVHSANVCRLVISRLYAFPVSLFPLAVALRWSEASQPTIAVPKEPSLRALFQRPPPFLT
jgi:hypothetical protein